MNYFTTEMFSNIFKLHEYLKCDEENRSFEHYHITLYFFIYLLCEPKHQLESLKALFFICLGFFHKIVEVLVAVKQLPVSTYKCYLN